MFGLGAGELILIAVVALLFVGPDKLPAAAKAIGKGIRDLRRQTSDLTRTIEEDTQIGEAVRDLRSALRGDDHAPPRRPQAPRPPQSTVDDEAPAATAANAEAASPSTGTSATPPPVADDSNANENSNDDGPVARGPATRPARPDVGAMAGLTTGSLRDQATAARQDATEADPAVPPTDDPGSGRGGTGSGSAHG